MLKRLPFLLTALLLVLTSRAALADEYQDTITTFRNAGESGSFFKTAYGYAVFPSIGKGGVGIGAAHGKGRVYERGKYIGDSTMTQVSVGAQLGGQVFKQIIFFQDERALREFTGGNFEFGAEASAVAITAGAGAQASTAGPSTGKSTSPHHAQTKGSYNKGMAVFTVAEGGLMYQATIGGQKFTFKPAPGASARRPVR